MITFYNRNETDFTHNGIAVLDNYIINPVVCEEVNGIFSLEFDFPLNAPYADELLQERIVKCPVPEMPPQLFRISEREAGLGGTFHIVAYHVFFDLTQNFIEDTFVVNRSGDYAVTQILGAAQFPHPFTGGSDISTVNSARFVRRNIVEAFLNGDLGNSFLSRWGGEILRDNFRIEMRRVRGSDNGVSIRNKKNLTGYRSNVDFGTVVTRIMPQGFDGLFLPEKYIDSPLIEHYLTPRIRVIKYEQVKAAIGMYADDEDALPLGEALELLRKLARDEFSVHHIDKPNASYFVEFAPLERTEEYKNFAVLESIAIGDVVKVIHDEDNLDITARMVSYKLTIANGFITNAMIADATIQSAKIAAIDAGKITTGTLTAARIGAGSITADKLATNAIQVGLEGWTNSIRISPTEINWYDGTSLQGKIQADGLYIYNGSSHIGTFAGSYAVESTSIRGISMHLSGGGSFISFGYRTGSSGTFSTVLVLDPQAKVRSQAGFHLGTDLCTNGFNFRSSGNRIVKMTDLSLTTGGTTLGTFPAWGSDSGRARIAFGTDHLYLVSNNVFCTVTSVTSRISELITRVNQLITRLNNGWVISATGTTSSYSGTGLTVMGTSLTT